MTKTYPYTFNDWMEGESGEVISVPVEGQDYQSAYVFKFNYLRDRGWIKRGKRWVRPDPPYTSYGTIHKAYDALLYWEMISEGTD